MTFECLQNDTERTRISARRAVVNRIIKIRRQNLKSRNRGDAKEKEGDEVE
jgi:hypothetical protein